MSNFNVNVSSSAIEDSLNVNKTSNVKKNVFDAKNYLDTKLGPNQTEKTVTIRILPVSKDDGNFRIVVKTHNLKVNRKVAESGFKSFLCLNDPNIPNYDPNVKCPICQKSQEYFNEYNACKDSDPSKAKTIFAKACSLRNKTTYILRVIDRSKETEGVKFWRFNENSKGEGVHDALINLYKTRKKNMLKVGINDYNIFDLNRGRDIEIGLKKTFRADGKENIAVTITDDSVDTPLTEDIEKGNSWINDEKKWYDAYTVKSHDYLTIIAEDKIPYFDRSLGKFVPKTEEDFLNAERGRLESAKQKEIEEAAAREILEERSTHYGNAMDYRADAMELEF